MINGSWTTGLLIGSVAGLAVGVVLGVLFAPEKGTRTRRQLVRKAEDLGERAADAMETANDLVERGRRRVGL